MDHLVKLETSIREANIQKQHLIAVFFDLEKAYETTWRFGIMKDVHSLGLRGRLPNFIKSFLLDRQFLVWIGSTFTNLYKQEERVLQGSILSVTLFNIRINSITRCLTPGIDGYLYVDGYKFLGVIFNRKLSFISHIECLKTKTTCAQQLLRVVAHTKWGADRQALLKLYRALVHSHYGIFIYRSARKSYIKKLDPIHHEGQIHIDTDLQAIIVKVTLGKPIHICSIYIPPHNPISDIKMNKLLQQILKSYLSLSDLNSHSTVWGSQKTN